MIEKMNKVVSRWEDLEISGSHSASRRLMLLTLETDLYLMNRDGSNQMVMTDDKQLHYQIKVHNHQSIDRCASHASI
jgi:hypothetical protein